MKNSCDSWNSRKIINEKENMTILVSLELKRKLLNFFLRIFRKRFLLRNADNYLSFESKYFCYFSSKKLFLKQSGIRRYGLSQVSSRNYDNYFAEYYCLKNFLKLSRNPKIGQNSAQRETKNDKKKCISYM